MYYFIERNVAKTFGQTESIYMRSNDNKMIYKSLRRGSAMIPHVLRKVDGNFECICGAKVCKAVKVNTMPATGSLRVNGLDSKGSNLKTDITILHQPSPGISNRRISVMSVQGQGMLTEPLSGDFFPQKLALLSAKL